MDTGRVYEIDVDESSDARTGVSIANRFAEFDNEGGARLEVATESSLDRPAWFLYVLPFLQRLGAKVTACVEYATQIDTEETNDTIAHVLHLEVVREDGKVVELDQGRSTILISLDGIDF